MFISNEVSALLVQGVRKNKVDTGVSFILLLSAAKGLTFCLILLKMTAYVLLLFSVFFPAIRSQNIPPIEDESDLWALVSVMSVFFTKAQIHSQKQNTIHAVLRYTRVLVILSSLSETRNSRCEDRLRLKGQLFGQYLAPYTNTTCLTHKDRE